MIIRIFTCALLLMLGSLCLATEIVIPDGWVEVVADNKKTKIQNDFDVTTGFISYAKDYLDPPGRRYTPARDEITDSYCVSLARGEYEPFIIGLYALSNQSVRIEISDLTSGQKRFSSENISIRIIKERAVRAEGFNRSPKKFRLIPSILEQSCHGNLIKGTTTGFWITLYAPIDTGPGEYQGKITIITGNKKKRELKLTANVLPFILEEIPGRSFAMLYTPVSHSPELEKNARTLMRDLRAHGMTAYSPIVSGWGKPLRFDREGRPDISNLLNHLQWAKDEGFSEPTILNIQKMIRAGRPGLDASYDKFDEKIDIPNLKTLVQFLEKEKERNNLPEIIYLPIDEPGCFTDRAGTRREEMAVLLLKTLSDLGVMGATTVADLVDSKHQRLPRWKNVAGWWDKISPYSSVRIYLNGYPQGKYNLENEMADAQKRGYKVMLYENTSTMGIDPAVSRMYYGFYGWRTGVAGVTSWTHPTYDYGTLHDEWENWEQRRLKRLSFFKDSGWTMPPSTVCWEMVREGIDDVKYLSVLATSMQQGEEATDRNRRLLQRLREEVGSTRMNDKKPQCNWDGQKFKAYREEIQTAIMRLITE